MKKLLSILLFTLTIALLLTSCGITVPRPEIKKHEFDFSVTYEFNGEVKTVSGVYVCEYDGTGWALDGGSHREWKSYFKNDEQAEPVRIGTTEDGGIVELNYGFYPEYFMGDPSWSWMEAPAPSLTVSHVNGEEVSIQNVADVIEKTYGARIISYQYAAPIVNEFGLLK